MNVEQSSPDRQVSNRQPEPDPDFAGAFPGGAIRDVDMFTENDLLDLFSGKTLILRQRNYLAKEQCGRAAALISANRHMEEYEVERVRRHYPSFMDVARNPALTEEYFAGAIEATRDQRRMFGEFGSVIDQLQSEIDAEWPAGCLTMTIPYRGRNRKVKRGTFREFPEGQKIDPHHDNFAFDCGDAFPTAPAVIRQLSFNVMLKCAPSGGELVVFTRRIQTPNEELALRDPQSQYGLLRDQLGESFAIKPHVGDLIIFCANRAHTVLPSYGDSRVTASLFACLTTADEPLLLVN